MRQKPLLLENRVIGFWGDSIKSIVSTTSFMAIGQFFEWSRSTAVTN